MYTIADPITPYSHSLHDALPIYRETFNFTIDGLEEARSALARLDECLAKLYDLVRHASGEDRKSTRLNSSHLVNSYAVFCVKKKIEFLPFIFSIACNTLRY